MKARAKLLLLALFALVVLFSPHKAHANGESYNYIDKNTIEGTDGSYPANGLNFVFDSVAQGGTDVNTAMYFRAVTPLTVGKCTRTLFMRVDVSGKQSAHDYSGELTGETLSSGGDCLLPVDAKINIANNNDARLKTPASDSPGADPTAALAHSKDLSTAVTGEDSTQKGSSCKGGGVLGTFKNVISGNIGGAIFSGLICPIITGITDGVTKVFSEALTWMLRIRPLEAGSKLHDVWANVRNLADAGLVVAFLVIIFANALSIDAYTVKKMLPRLVAAAVLIQLSFLICGLMVDVGNVLGDGARTVIGGLAASDSAIETNLAVGAVGAIAITLGVLAWPFIIPLLLLLLIAVMVFLLIFGLRFILVAMFIILSPLALLAWVLPNTEQYFKLWYKQFFRLIMMYPLTMAILAVAGKIDDLLPTEDVANNGVANVMASIMKVIIFIAALAVAPMTFKWGGSLMNRGASMIQGLGKKASDKYKGSEWKAGLDRQARARMTGRVGRSSEAVQKFGQKDAQGRRQGTLAGMLSGRAQLAGLGMVGVPTSALAQERSFEADVGKSTKDYESFGVSKNPGVMERVARGSAEDLKYLRENGYGNLVQYARTDSGRAAAARMLAANGYSEQVESFRGDLASKVKANQITEAAASRSWRQMLNGEGGKLFESDWGLAMGGWSGNEDISAGFTQRRTSAAISKLMGSRAGVERAMFKGGAADTDRRFDSYTKVLGKQRMRGTSALFVDPNSVRGAMRSPALIANTNIEGRRAFYSAIMDAGKDGRLQQLRDSVTAYRTAGNTTEADFGEAALARYADLRQTVEETITPEGNIIPPKPSRQGTENPAQPGIPTATQADYDVIEGDEDELGPSVGGGGAGNPTITDTNVPFSAEEAEVEARDASSRGDINAANYWTQQAGRIRNEATTRIPPSGEIQPKPATTSEGDIEYTPVQSAPAPPPASPRAVGGAAYAYMDPATGRWAGIDEAGAQLHRDMGHTVVRVPRG